MRLPADALWPWRATYRRVPVREDVVLLGTVGALVHSSEGAALAVAGRGSRAVPGIGQALVRGARYPVAVVPSQTCAPVAAGVTGRMSPCRHPV
ncbi:hypothetical protein LK07_30385 [Streptomyces pluripotens]|uniref:UspA domain-containing protein n=1 Tax=Streptomyces pluripotens TaxID=1355015 RepID=A0A221P616_9ACTN|nr:MULTISPECIES: hypothetical protein [Streptomyces]ARP73382.1 hypothetical protein LK06_029215 [Streptomyces pluripotens]ASN27630.1 hypothetical protein LK07_30385 [Streptomyces pluripotens]KIE28549.1 hypothetical protein LK08_02505 [Streptomyces sp. MUSC 125]MCH0560311.1 hypothetical protein [Streptomyces sp. MUM 16J]